tara:strand:- start:275 stop:952 length:678 start_codon:yes stop_codon:yes gene_type:complete
MATTKVVDVLDRASIILQDTSHVRYPNAELEAFFNDAQKEIVLHRPDANMVNATHACATGSKQTLTATALRLIDVVRNQNGRSITQVDRRILDETLPDWHETAANATRKIEHFIFDAADPKTFYVYPKAVSGTHSIEIVYSSVPADSSISNFDTDTSVIGIDDVYAGAILDFILYRCYQKDSEYAGNTARAQMHYQGFVNALGIKTQADAAISPRPDLGMRAVSA